MSLLMLVSLLPLVTAGAAIIGLGLVRGLGPASIALSTTAMLLFPVVGLWSLLGRSRGALAGSMAAWPTMFLVGLPGFFPDQLGDAISTGYAVLASPAGEQVALRASELAGGFRAPVATLPQGTDPPPDAARPAAECPPPSTVSTGDQVALPYEGQGHSLAIPVSFGDTELPMLFDTGASLTTLNAASLHALGLRVPADAPEVTLRTANGARSARIVLIDEVWIGGFRVGGVSVAVCEECADDKVRGLLGLNVSGQFLVTLDTARREVVLQERGVVVDRLVDVAPWLDVDARAAIYPDQRVEVTVNGHNRATRPVREAKVGVSCGDEKFVVVLSDIPPFGTITEIASLPRGTSCDAYRVTVDGAGW